MDEEDEDVDDAETVQGGRVIGLTCMCMESANDGACIMNDSPHRTKRHEATSHRLRICVLPPRTQCCADHVNTNANANIQYTITPVAWLSRHAHE